MTIWKRLNPRHHLAAAIAWAVFSVVALAAAAAAEFAATEAARRARADAEGLLDELATQVRDALSMSIDTRRTALRLTASQIAAAPAPDLLASQRALAATQTQFPEFAWLGMTDAQGRILLATGQPSQGADVSALPWFMQGRVRPFVSDQHAGTSQPVTGQHADLPAGQRLLDVAVPLHTGGVLAAAISWSWLEQHLQRMQQAFSNHRPVELLLLARDGRVLVGPMQWQDRLLASEAAVAEDGRYLLGSRAQLRLADGLGLGWTAIVRQPADAALLPARSTRRVVFLSVFSSGLLAAVIAALATQLLMRRLTRLAAQAEAVRRGDRQSLQVPPGLDEVSRIGAALAEAVDHLQAEKLALQSLNAELDQRVAERTRRIEGMAAESRHAAVARERLRIARDLHDTLAHSLMALLTQIRLVRKLHKRMGERELEEELDRAAEVAGSGLSGARAAIAQMRDNDVRDSGLGPALHELTRRFHDRTGLQVALSVAEASAALTDERAQTVFRIVEEALRNVERHADAREVRVQLLAQARGEAPMSIQVEVVDDGIGFDPTLPHPGHFGLRGMHEQAALIGARLEVQSQPGRGTRIALEFHA